jgi:hypothetical protein
VIELGNRDRDFLAESAALLRYFCLRVEKELEV